jgi:anion-transporting  ArsA/GET3 family ATPase
VKEHKHGLLHLFNRRVIVCAGSGGVGKTSVAAATGVAAAQKGKQVIVLTIDPARRLADSLGVHRDSSERQYLDIAKQQALGITTGSLSVMMLDAGRTLREMITKLAPDVASADRILQHPLFKYLADYLAGANEYMAMEKLLTVLQEETFDLLILDTPPSRHALDFLDAPNRLTDAIDGPVTRAFTQALNQGSRWGLDLVARGASLVLKSLGRLTGAGLLEQLATLIGELNAIFGGFGQRARIVADAFRDPSFAFVLITRPARAAVEDTLMFGEALRSRGLRVDAVVMNKVHALDAPVSDVQATEAVDAVLGSGLRERVSRAVQARAQQVAEERRFTTALQGGTALRSATHLSLPAVAGGVSNVDQLTTLAATLGSGASN